MLLHAARALKQRRVNYVLVFFLGRIERSAESGECFESRGEAQSKVMSTAFSPDGEERSSGIERGVRRVPPHAGVFVELFLSVSKTTS